MGSLEWLVRAELVKKINNVTDIKFDLSDYEIEDNFRVYTTDLSLLIAMKDFSLKQKIVENTLTDITKGGIYECAICDVLIKKDIDIWFYKNETKKKELDFIIQKEGRVIPIEVKAGNTKAGSLKWASKNSDIEFGYKFVDGNVGVDKENKVITLPIYMIMFI